MQGRDGLRPPSLLGALHALPPLTSRRPERWALGPADAGLPHSSCSGLPPSSRSSPAKTLQPSRTTRPSCP